MDFSGIYNQLLINSAAVCLHPSLIEGYQIITPYIAPNSDTNSSLGSESGSETLPENGNERDDDELKDNLINNTIQIGDEKEDENKCKKIQRIR